MIKDPECKRPWCGALDKYCESCVQYNEGAERRAAQVQEKVMETPAPFFSKRALTDAEKQKLLDGLDWKNVWIELHRIMPGKGAQGTFIRGLQTLNDINLKAVIKMGIDYVERAYQNTGEETITANLGPFLIVREPEGARLQLTVVENQVGEMEISQASVYGKVRIEK